MAALPNGDGIRRLFWLIVHGHMRAVQAVRTRLASIPAREIRRSSPIASRLRASAKSWLPRWLGFSDRGRMELQYLHKPPCPAHRPAHVSISLRSIFRRSAACVDNARAARLPRRPTHVPFTKSLLPSVVNGNARPLGT